MGYIYLIQEREFLTQNSPIYKIGKSGQENCRRLNSYPKGSKLILCIEVQFNYYLVEKELIKLFLHSKWCFPYVEYCSNLIGNCRNKF